MNWEESESVVYNFGYWAVIKLFVQLKGLWWMLNCI